MLSGPAVTGHCCFEPISIKPENNTGWQISLLSAKNEWAPVAIMKILGHFGWSPVFVQARFVCAQKVFMLTGFLCYANLQKQGIHYMIS